MDSQQRPNVAGRRLPKVHLASRSPRRRELLTSAGIEHDAAGSGLDDAELVRGAGVSPASWVMALAYLKAAAALKAGDVVRAPVVLGADTVGLHEGKVIGQPRSAEDARAMLRCLRNAEHEVLTGVALLKANATGDSGASEPRREMFVDRATVRLGDLADEEIERYVASGAWRGKAGAYNLAEQLAAGWPITYSGDPATIMGLPMRMLPERLERFWEVAK